VDSHHPPHSDKSYSLFTEREREREREKHSVILLKLLQSDSVLKKKEETLFKVTDYVVDTRSKAVAG